MSQNEDMKTLDDPKGEALSSSEASPKAATERHAPREPARQELPQQLYEKRKAVHNKRIDGPFAGSIGW